MDKPISILLVDDNPDDRLMVRRVLGREFSSLRVHEANDKSGFEAALGMGGFDLAVTDYHLNWSDGLAVLRALKHRWTGLPVIMFTGTGTEEVAVEAMKTGLDDYVLKSPKHVARLPMAVRGALDRAAAARRALAAEGRLRDLLDRLDVGIFTVSEDGHFLAANQACFRILGLDPECDIFATTTVQFYADTNERAEVIADLRRHGRIRERPVRLHRMDGSSVWVALTESMSAADGGSMVIEGIMEDITPRKGAEQALRKSEEQLRLLFQHAPVGIFHFDTHLIITSCNDHFVSILQSDREKLIGLNMNLLRDARVLPAIRAAIAGESGEYEGWYDATTSLEHRFVLLRTAPLFDDEGATSGGVGIVEDLTNHKKAEEEVRLKDEALRQAQKMEAVGQLAGGVAHDFNNVLQALMSLAQVVRLRGSDPVQLAAAIDELEQHVKRGAGLTRQLLLFSRREVTKPEPLDLNEVVRVSMTMLRRLLRENIILGGEVATGSYPVTADRGQLEQVLTNLVLNAVDAMPNGGGLIIRTGHTGGSEVWLEVADMGHGMPPEIAARVFEPFFTTKLAGKGTGLGLSVVHGIATQHGGRVEVTSKTGAGSTFRLVLPRVPQEGLAEAPGEPAERLDAHHGVGRRVLLVEDEAMARESLREVLSELGYQVTAVGRAEEALDLPREHPFDVLLSDLVLPGISGIDLAELLRSRWLALQVILMSGYSEDSVARLKALGGAVRFLQKPFDMTTLARELKAALQ